MKKPFAALVGFVASLIGFAVSAAPLDITELGTAVDYGNASTVILGIFGSLIAIGILIWAGKTVYGLVRGR